MTYCSVRWVCRCVSTLNQKTFYLKDYQDKYPSQDLEEDLEACRQAGHRVTLIDTNNKVICSGIPLSNNLVPSRKCWFNSQNQLFITVKSIINVN